MKVFVAMLFMIVLLLVGLPAFGGVSQFDDTGETVDTLIPLKVVRTEKCELVNVAYTRLATINSNYVIIQTINPIARYDMYVILAYTSSANMVGIIKANLTHTGLYGGVTDRLRFPFIRN